jgi:hypothetical protein
MTQTLYAHMNKIKIKKKKKKLIKCEFKNYGHPKKKKKSIKLLGGRLPSGN